IDIDLFEEQMRSFPLRDRKFYVIISKDDKALAVSRTIAGKVSRVGNAPPERLAELGVIVIDLTQIKDVGNLNHSKFNESPTIVQQIGKHINEGGSLGDNAAIPLTDSDGVIVTVGKAATRVVTTPVNVVRRVLPGI
ncbi:MAG: alpha/beta hydrolase, partial [Pseudomonadota bacterium]